MNPLIRIIPAMTALSVIASCTKADTVSAGYGTVHLSFAKPADYQTTKSCFVDEQEESTIFDYGVIIWDEAHPERKGLHMDITGERTQTILPSGNDYFAVGFANLGTGNNMYLYNLDPDGDLYLFKFVLNLAAPYYNSLNSQNDGIAMVSTYGKHFHLDEGEDIDLCFQLERVLAKIIISLDKSMLQNADVQIESVSIKNCSYDFLPVYTDDGPYRDIRSSNHIQGDKADEDQVQNLNSGKEIALYTIENLQGYRQSLAEMKRYCTYLEIEASHSLLGDITYRCFIGDGTSGNCDVKRNCVYRVKIVPTDTAGGASCWRAEY